MRSTASASERPRSYSPQGSIFLELYDGEHFELEERFTAIGPIRRGLVLVVYTERSEDTVRIISARWASQKERVLYLEYMEKQS